VKKIFALKFCIITLEMFMLWYRDLNSGKGRAFSSLQIALEL